MSYVSLTVELVSTLGICFGQYKLTSTAEAIPDITNQLAPSKWGDVATYFFFSVAGLFLGGEIGLLTGTASATRTINSDPAAKERIGTALKKFRVDVLKREIKELEGKSTFEQIFSPGS